MGLWKAQTDASIFPLEFLKKKTDSQKIKPLFYISEKNCPTNW